MRLLKCKDFRSFLKNVIIGIFFAAAALLMSVPLGGCSNRRELIIEQGSDSSQEEDPVPDRSTEGAADHDNEEERTEDEPEITVFVCGAVREEGVYRLKPGARVIDAVSAAGGFSEDADTSWLNLASCAEDGQMIRVPTREEGEKLREGDFAQQESETSEGAFRVNINTADASELQRLPGVGEVRAARILAYRREHGAFKEPAELRNVSGIGEAVYEGMKDYITVGDPR